MITAHDLGVFAANASIEKTAGPYLDAARPLLSPFFRMQIEDPVEHVAMPTVLGAGVGGVLGGLFPGHSVREEADGNLTAKKRSRLMGLLRGAGYGAATGAGLGTASASVVPIFNFLQHLEGGNRPKAS
jgi:hypothetical protein